MSPARRPQLDDRRRMVIYSQRYVDDETLQTQRARGVDPRVREARRPASAYVWRVQRRLRARWYGLVPVRRRTLGGVIAALGLLTVLLSVGHWASLFWGPVANRPDVARVLRLDRADSLGAWVSTVVMLLATGAAFLVYQLRRYRADDYHGHYRLWRIAILVALFVSIDSSVGLAAALGGVIDIAIAEREVLAGADWVQLICGIGGAAFGLRMIGELGRQRWAAVLLTVGLVLMALGPAVRWNFIRWDAMEATLWIPIGLLVGRALLLLAVITYLRMLYREVRKMEAGPGFIQQMRQWLPAIPRLRKEESAGEIVVEEKRPSRKKVAPRESKVAAEGDQVETDVEKPRWWKLGRRTSTPSDARPSKVESEARPVEETVKAKSPARVKTAVPVTNQGEATDQVRTSPTLKERMMGKLAGLWKRPAASSETLAEELGDGKHTGARDGKQVVEAKGKSVAAVESAKANAASGVAKPVVTVAKPSSPVPNPPAANPPVPASAPSTSPAATTGGGNNDDDDDEEGGDDDVDWGGMNKAERRRMRKLMKRQGKAA